MADPGSQAADVAEAFDVVIVGAGPAGLSGALMLGRCCRRVLLCDSGQPRNIARHMHCYLTRDGADPMDLRRLGRQELARYDNVTVRDVEVVGAARDQRRESGFLVRLGDGTLVSARRLLLATGLVDELPAVPGLRALWGKAAFPCPYCDAWEFRGRRIGVLGHGEGALGLCRALAGWSRDLILVSHQPDRISPEQERHLNAGGVPVVRGVTVTGVRGVPGGPADGQAVQISFADGSTVERDVLFVSNAQHQRSPLVQALGCQLNQQGRVATGNHESTNVPGLFVAGDASENVQFAMVAAAEGLEAGFEINRTLAREDFQRPGAQEPQSSRTVQTSRLAT